MQIIYRYKIKTVRTCRGGKIINIIFQRIKIELTQIWLKLLWRKKNKDNFTNIKNTFPIDHVRVGKGTYGGIKVIDYGKKSNLLIGNYCSIAEEVTFILSGEHPMDRISTFPFDVYYLKKEENIAETNGDIVIEDDVWIGYGATILSGVRIGQGAVIASGAIVTKDVEPYSVVGGVPAKHIKYRFSKEIREKLLNISFEKIDVECILKSKNIFNRPIDSSNIDYILDSLHVSRRK